MYAHYERGLLALMLLLNKIKIQLALKPLRRTNATSRRARQPASTRSQLAVRNSSFIDLTTVLRYGEKTHPTPTNERNIVHAYRRLQRLQCVQSAVLNYSRT